MRCVCGRAGEAAGCRGRLSHRGTDLAPLLGGPIASTRPQTQGLAPCGWLTCVFNEKVSMTGANVLKRGHNIEMNEAFNESLCSKPTTSPDGRAGREKADHGKFVLETVGTEKKWEKTRTLETICEKKKKISSIIVFFLVINVRKQ